MIDYVSFEDTVAAATQSGTALLYRTADWLRFVDTASSVDRRSGRRYLRSGSGASRVWIDIGAPGDQDDESYDPSVMLQRKEGGILLLGGNRGYSSEPIGERGVIDEESLAVGLDALTESSRPDGSWWWPYLSTDVADLVVRNSTATKQLIDMEAVVGVPPGGIEEYVAGIRSAGRRNNVRAERRRFAASEGRIEQGHLQDCDLGVLADLLAQVQRKHGHDVDVASIERQLAFQRAALGAKSVVFSCLDADDRVIGFSLFYEHADCLWLRVVGLDYASVGRAGEYAELTVYVPVEFASNAGIPRIHLGLGSFEAKFRRGATPVPLWAAHDGPPTTKDDNRRALERILADIAPREAAIMESLVFPDAQG